MIQKYLKIPICPHSTNMNIIENLCVDVKHAVHARWTKTISEQDVGCKENG